MSVFTIKGRNIEVRNAELVYKNFAGGEKTNNGRIMNAGGKRNFNILIRDEETAMELKELGLRIKPYKREEGVHTVKITVNFDSKYPPTVQAWEGSKCTNINGDNAEILDGMRILDCDLRINLGVDKNDPSLKNCYLNALLCDIEVDTMRENWERRHSEDYEG